MPQPGMQDQLLQDLPLVPWVPVLQPQLLQREWQLVLLPEQPADAQTTGNLVQKLQVAV